MTLCYPVEPLIAATVTGRTADYQSNRERPPHGPSALADAWGVSKMNVYRWQRSGIPWYQADRISIRIGRHPAELWPDWR